MSSNTENTEAKLAAYIDGQLPAAERAELDQFLAKNPDLQKLLSDLIAQRALLRTLPRDRAPSDIYDTIQAQLERSVLLDDSSLTITPPVRHSRKSQLFAIAAILLLAVGLGSVLYFALPSSKPTPVEVAATSRPEITAIADESEAKGALSLRPTRQTIPLADAGAASLPPSPIASNVSSPNPLAQALAASTGGEFKSQIQTTQSFPQDQVVLLVSTTNPAKASQQVATYLAANNISYESVDPASQQQQQTFYNRADGIVLGAAPKSLDFSKKIAEPTAEDRAPGAAPSTGSFASRRASRSGDVEKDAVDQQQSQKSAVAQTESALKELSIPEAAILNQNDATTQTARAPVRPYILARGITRQQAAQLTSTLSTEQTSQRARLVVDAPSQFSFSQKSESQSAPTTAPATPAVNPEFTLSLNKQPTTLPAETATTVPTTQPNEPLDILIVVEDEQPTTAPATTSPATEP